MRLNNQESIYINKDEKNTRIQALMSLVALLITEQTNTQEK